MEKEKQIIVKSYDDIERALKEAENSSKRVCITTKEIKLWAFVTFGRSIKVEFEGEGLKVPELEFHAFDKAVKYIFYNLFPRIEKIEDPYTDPKEWATKIFTKILYILGIIALIGVVCLIASFF